MVVGYGNGLRRDDGVGVGVAEAVGRRGLDGVVVRTVTQLVPELVEEMAMFDRVVFVDASLEAHSVMPVRVAPGPSSHRTHHSDPPALLALAHSLGGAVPEVWLVAVPVEDLSIGIGLSPSCARWARVAERHVAALCADGEPDGTN